MVSYEMAVVVDFQGFKSLDNKFIVKELAIVSLDGESDLQFLFKPPQPFCTLSREMKKRVAYLTNHVHGLWWDFGDMYFGDYVADILRNVHTIYVKGIERANYIRSLTGDVAQIINLDDFIGTSVKYSCEECSSHVINCGRCSLYRAKELKIWLLEHGFVEIICYV